MKRCVDCKHCYWPPFATGSQLAINVLAECRHPKVTNPHIYEAVVGRMDAWQAKEMRERETYDHKTKEACGLAAKWFEPHGREPGV